MGPTKVTEIAHLPNVVLKPGRAVKFFLCDNGHIEPWLGEEDLASMPPRPCSSCHKKMALVSRRVKKDGTLAPTKHGPRSAKKVAVVKTPSDELLLRRFARCLYHPYVKYVVEYPRPDMIRVTRKGERATQKGGRVYRRFVEVTIDSGTMRADIELFGVRGWFEDFRVAGKKCKLNPVARFSPAFSTMIAKRKKKVATTPKGG